MCKVVVLDSRGEGLYTPPLLTGDKTMRVYDSLAEYVVNRGVVHHYIQKHFLDYTEATPKVVCPFHNDTVGSLHIYPDGSAHCFGCGYNAHNIFQLTADTTKKPYTQVRLDIYRDLMNHVPKVVVGSTIESLYRNKKARKYWADRGITQDVINNFDLGYDPSTDRVTIPIYDFHKSCVNIRKRLMRRPKDKQEQKMISIKGHGETRLYPEWLLKDYDTIYFVEGEIDALSGWCVGLPTFTWTNGAGAWNTEYEYMLKGKHVFLMYDQDEAGQAHEKVMEENFKRIGCSVVIPDRPNKLKDLNDQLRLNRKWLEKIGRMYKAYLGGSVKVKATDVCLRCGQIVPAQKPSYNSMIQLMTQIKNELVVNHELCITGETYDKLCSIVNANEKLVKELKDGNK